MQPGFHRLRTCASILISVAKWIVGVPLNRRQLSRLDIVRIVLVAALGPIEESAIYLLRRVWCEIWLIREAIGEVVRQGVE